MEYTAQSNALVIRQHDRKGVISNIAGVLAQHDINIGVMRLSRRARGDVACTIIEADAFKMCIRDSAYPPYHRL